MLPVLSLVLCFDLLPDGDHTLHAWSRPPSQTAVLVFGTKRDSSSFETLCCLKRVGSLVAIDCEADTSALSLFRQTPDTIQGTNVMNT